MPRFYFNVSLAGAEAPDQDDIGTVLPNHQAARRMALRLAGDMIWNGGMNVTLDGNWRMEVTDDRALVLYQLDFVIVASPVVAYAPKASGTTSVTCGLEA